MENQGKWTINREFLYYAHRKVDNSRPEFWQVLLVSTVFLDIQLQFCCIIKNYSLKSENIN